MKRVAKQSARVAGVKVLDRYTFMSGIMMRCNGVGVDLSHLRHVKRLWPRVVVAYALYKEGFTEHEIASVMNRNRSTICHYKGIMEDAMQFPLMYQELLSLNNEFQTAKELCLQ